MKKKVLHSFPLEGPLLSQSIHRLCQNPFGSIIKGKHFSPARVAARSWAASAWASFPRFFARSAAPENWMAPPLLYRTDGTERERALFVLAHWGAVTVSRNEPYSYGITSAVSTYQNATNCNGEISNSISVLKDFGQPCPCNM